MRVLESGETSSDNMVRPVSRRAFAPAAKALARTDERAALYTSPGPSPLERINFDLPVVYVVSGQNIICAPKTRQELYKILDERRAYVAKQYRESEISHEVYAESLNFLNALEKEFRALLTGFEGYSIYAIAFKYNTPNTDKHNLDPSMHQDFRHPARNTIILTRTVYGPSTVYENRKDKIQGSVRPPDGSLCAHTGDGIKHRSPLRCEYQNKPRFTIVIGLQSAIPTTR